jgi:hypothetical protein
VSSPLSPEEIRAAAEAHAELGPGYRDAVIESFLDRIGRAIDERVDARMAQQQAMPPVRSQRRLSGSPLTLPVTSLVAGIPFSAIIFATSKDLAAALTVIALWIGTTLINVIYVAGHRPGHR